MATKTILTNPTVKIDDSAGTPVDITAQVTGLTITEGVNTETTNASGDTTEVSTATILTWSASVAVLMAYGTGSVEETISGGIGKTVTFTGTSNGLTPSVSNPSFSGEAIVTSFSPIDGAHGDVIRGTIELASAGPLTRAIA